MTEKITEESIEEPVDEVRPEFELDRLEKALNAVEEKLKYLG